MFDWFTIPHGKSIEVDREGRTIQVHHSNHDLFVVQRFFDGTWQDTVWVRRLGGSWRVSREPNSIGIHAPDLASAVEAGLARSGEALR
ncbi:MULTISPECIES: hypothetical protein [unclassified Rathayibacter]|uniref:hypothetical protein n=1 Tax=unclassified Rathayibacter TaxID=2609250 RepID=UPI0011B03F16|nr:MULTISPECIES: hypothetical protein [unclassified Rathayibacter]